MAKKNRIEMHEKRIERSETKLEALKRQIKEEQDRLKNEEEALKVERYERILEKFWELEIDDEDQIEQIIDDLVKELKEENILKENTENDDDGGVYNGTI